MTHTFKTSLGGNAVISAGTALFYKIYYNASKRQDDDTVTLTGPDFKVDLRGFSGNEVVYVTVSVQKYKVGDVEYTVPSGVSITLCATFSANSDTVGISLLTTVATLFAFTQMIHGTGPLVIYGDANRINICHGMYNNLVLDDGSLSTVISSGPNGNQTNSLGVLNFLSNLLHYSFLNSSVYNALTEMVPEQYNYSPFSALMYVVLNPNCGLDLYSLTKNMEPLYTPTLSANPPVWAMAVKFNESGSNNFLPAGTAFVVFDKMDRAWVTNNFRQGTPNSGTHVLVYESNGKPAGFSPLTGGGILGPGFGVAINAQRDTIAIGNYGWGTEDNNPREGSVSMFDYNGKVLSPPSGYTQMLSRVQGMCYDSNGHLYMASWGTQDPMAPAPAPTYNYPGQYSALVVYPNGNPDLAVSYDFKDFIPASEHNGTFCVVIGKDGSAYVSNAGHGTINGATEVTSSVFKLRLQEVSKNSYVINYENHWISDKGFEDFRQIEVGIDGDVYVGGLETERIVRLNGSDLSFKEEIILDTIHGPWGIKADQNGKLYIANFADGGDDTKYGVTVLDPENPSASYILELPSGGEEVLLANKQPLYGDASGLKSYNPIMRLTSTNIDGAGNLWAMNNWKPDASIDTSLTDANPGGDGVVVFLGVATPA